MTLIKYKSVYVIPMFKTFQWFPITLRIKSKFFIVAYKVLYFMTSGYFSDLIAFFFTRLNYTLVSSSPSSTTNMFPPRGLCTWHFFQRLSSLTPSHDSPNILFKSLLRWYPLIFLDQSILNGITHNSILMHWLIHN